MTFERSTDYALIRAILTEPRCWRRMGHRGQDLSVFEVAALEGIDYIVAYEDGARNATANAFAQVPVAVFLIVQGVEVHFCFVPAVWGRTLPIARAFLVWVWSTTNAQRLLGPVPVHNRLALRLATACGFKEYATRGENVLTEIRKP